MILKHNKTGNLYYLGSEKCKAKINGEWKDAVLYRGWEKNTGEYYHFVWEKSDFDSHFTVIGDVKTGYNLTVLQKQLSVLRGGLSRNIQARPLRMLSCNWRQG